MFLAIAVLLRHPLPMEVGSRRHPNTTSLKRLLRPGARHGAYQLQSAAL